MGFRLFMLAFLLTVSVGMAASAEQTDTDERVLNNRLNNLESRTIQRQGREQRGQDLLIRQERRLARQELNSLKTRKPGSASLRRSERKLRRSR